MYPFNRVWFWLLLISLILIIASLVSFSFYGNIRNLQNTPFLITLTFIIGVIFLIISFVVFLVSIYGFHEKIKKKTKKIARKTLCKKKSSSKKQKDVPEEMSELENVKKDEDFVNIF